MGVVSQMNMNQLLLNDEGMEKGRAQIPGFGIFGSRRDGKAI